MRFFGVSVARTQKSPVPHYKTGTNWVCQIEGLLMKPEHVCLCVPVSFILNPDPNKIQPNHTSPLPWKEGRVGANQEKKDGDFFFS